MSERLHGTGRAMWWTDWTDSAPCLTFESNPVREMDPALKRFLDNLPKGDPDAQPPEHVEVWTVWTEGRREVPCGVEVTVDLGKWAGPRMLVSDIVIWQRNVRTGVERKLRGASRNKSEPYMLPGQTMTLTGWTFQP